MPLSLFLVGLLGAGALLLQRDVATGAWGRRMRSRATPSPVTVAMARARMLCPAEAFTELDHLHRRSMASSQDVGARVQLGERLKALGELEGAAVLLQQARRLDPENAHVLFMLAEIETAQQRPARAVHLLRRLLQSHPDNVAARHRLADLLRENGHERSAWQLYEVVLTAEPGNSSARIWRDFLAARQGSLRDGDPMRRRGRLTRALRPLGSVGIVPLACVGVTVFLCRRRMVRCVWRDALSIYVVAIVALHVAHVVRVTADPALVGEELDFAFRNLVYLDHAIQPDAYSTTFSSVLLYRLASVLPGGALTIHYARVFRLWLLAGLPVVAALLARRLVTQQRRLAGWSAAILCLSMTPVVWLGIMSVDYCLDAMFGLSAVLLADRIRWDARPRTLLVLLLTAVLLTAWTVHLYAASLVIFPVLALQISCRLAGYWRRSPATRADAPWRPLTPAQATALWLVVGVTVTVVIQWPRLLYTTRPLLLFSGARHPALDVQVVERNLSIVLSDMFAVPKSYLLLDNVRRGAFPWQGTGVAAGALALVGGVTALRRRTGERAVVLLAIAALSLLAALVVPENGGIRRCIPCVVVLCVFAGAGCARFRAVPRRDLLMLGVGLLLWVPVTAVVRHLALGAPGWWPVALSACVTTMALAVVSEGVRPRRSLASALLLLLLAGASWGHAWGLGVSYRRYQPWIQKQFALLAEADYEMTVERLIERMRREQLSFSSEQYDPETFFMLFQLARQRGVAYVPPRYSGPWDERLPLAPYIAADSDVRPRWPPEEGERTEKQRRD